MNTSVQTTLPHASYSTQRSGTATKETLNTSKNNVKERKQAYEQLSTSLESGDLTSAKEAYDSIKKNAPTNWTNPSSNSPKAYAFGELGSALASGNLTGARKAFSDFKNASSQDTPNVNQAKSHQNNTTTNVSGEHSTEKTSNSTIHLIA